MSNFDEKMIKRQSVLADGRYVIFYTFEHSASLESVESDAKADAEKPDEREQRV